MYRTSSVALEGKPNIVPTWRQCCESVSSRRIRTTGKVLYVIFETIVSSFREVDLETLKSPDTGLLA